MTTYNQSLQQASKLAAALKRYEFLQKYMKYLILIVLIICSHQSTASKAKDAEFKKNIVGIWLAEYKEEDYVSYGEIFYKKDGTYIDKGYACEKDKCEESYAKGTYKIEDGVLLITLTETNIPGLNPGFLIRNYILSIDEKKAVFLSAGSGEKFVRDRLDESKYFQANS